MIKLLNTIAQESDSFLSDCEMENESGALLLEKKEAYNGTLLETIKRSLIKMKSE